MKKLFFALKWKKQQQRIALKGSIFNLGKQHNLKIVDFF